jgi:hypothetical protein
MNWYSSSMGWWWLEWTCDVYIIISSPYWIVASEVPSRASGYQPDACYMYVCMYEWMYQLIARDCDYPSCSHRRWSQYGPTGSASNAPCRILVADLWTRSSPLYTHSNMYKGYLVKYPTNYIIEFLVRQNTNEHANIRTYIQQRLVRENSDIIRC